LQNVPPNVLANAGAWAAHMGISSNTRYQIINGLDMVGWCLLLEHSWRANRATITFFLAF